MLHKLGWQLGYVSSKSLGSLWHRCDFVFKLRGHFRIVLCLFFKARPHAKPFIWKWVLSACEWKLAFLWKAMPQDSIWKRGTRQLGNGLFVLAITYRLVSYPTNKWCRYGIHPRKQDKQNSNLCWIFTKLQRGKNVCVGPVVQSRIR